MRRFTGPALMLLALAGAWELFVDAGGADPLLLPAPHAIASELWTDRSLLFSSLLTTGEEIVLGILVAVLVGLGLAFAIHAFGGALRRAVYPLLIASQTIPIPMIAPLLVLWLGFGIAPKLVVIALVSFFSILVATLDALASVDPDLIKLMRTFDAPRRRIFRHVELPSALPGVFTGTKIAVVVAVIGAVFAEWSGTDAGGLGYAFQIATAQLQPARAYASVLLLSLFAIALFVLLDLVEKRALPWVARTKGGTPA